MAPRAELLRSPRAVAGLLCAATLVAYANSFAGVPQFDDYAVILDEPRVASLAAWWGSMPGMRPLLKLSYAINRSVGGLVGFHALNLAIHLGCVLLGWRLLLRLLPGPRTGCAALGALVFALHPVNTEAVSLLSGRSMSLSALGMLASLLCLLEGRKALSVLLFAATLGVRETALALPALATLCLAWQEQHRGRAGLAVALRETRWHWLVAAVGMLLLLAMPRYRELLAFSMHLRGPLENLVTQAGGVAYLLGQLFRPFALNADPRLPLFEGWDLRWAVLCSVWVVALGGSLVQFRKGNWLAFALLWFAIAVAPTNSLVARLDVANERQLYLAALPFYAAIGLAWERVWPTSLRLPALLVGVLLAATVLRNRDYHSEAAFWGAVLARDPANARAWNNLGYALEREQPQGAEAALAAYRRAAALDRADYKARHNLMRLCGRAAVPAACVEQ